MTPRPAVTLDLVICTHNHADGLDEVLDRVAQLRSPRGLRWSVLVVDNASSDRTPAVVRRHAARGTIPIRYVHEAEPGLTPARLRGVRESSAEWLAFVDDDNLLEPGWLEAIAAGVRAWPQAGGIGGRVLLQWDAPPCGAAAEFGFCFAEQDLGEAPREVESLVGAGMALRRDALEASGWTAGPLLDDRIGKSLVSGGDVEIALRVRAAGYQLWYAPAAVLRHRQSSERSSRRYLLRINHALGASAAVVSLLGWRGDYAAWRKAQRQAAARRLAEAGRGLAWSLRAGRKLTAATAWMSFALGFGRGVRAVEQMPPQRREALMGRAAWRQPAAANGSPSEAPATGRASALRPADSPRAAESDLPTAGML